MHFRIGSMFCSMNKNCLFKLNLIYCLVSLLGMKNELDKLQLRLIQPSLGFVSKAKFGDVRSKMYVCLILVAFHVHVLMSYSVSILERSYQRGGRHRELMTNSLWRKLKWPVATKLTLPLGGNFTPSCQQIKGMGITVTRGRNHRKSWHRVALKEILSKAICQGKA